MPEPKRSISVSTPILSVRVDGISQPAADNIAYGLATIAAAGTLMAVTALIKAYLEKRPAVATDAARLAASEAVPLTFASDGTTLSDEQRLSIQQAVREVVNSQMSAILEELKKGGIAPDSGQAETPIRT